MNPGDPGARELGQPGRGEARRWPALDARVYDPEPTSTTSARATRRPPMSRNRAARTATTCYTCSLVAVNVDTGKMAWGYQTSPRDTHDWDSAQTPVLVDGEFNGRPRKLIMTAARNGYFFVLDRVTGEHLLTSTFADVDELGEGRQREGPADSRSRRRTRRLGARWCRRPRRGGELAAAELQPADRAVLRAGQRDLRDVLPDRDRSARRDGPRRARQMPARRPTGTYLAAIDYKTGKIAWRHDYPGSGGGGNGVLSTAGGLVFAGDIGGELRRLRRRQRCGRCGTRGSAR